MAYRIHLHVNKHSPDTTVRLKPVTEFIYLGSTLSNDSLIDKEITRPIALASTSFGRLKKDYGIKEESGYRQN